MQIDLRELGELIRVMNPYSPNMEHLVESIRPPQEGEEASSEVVAPEQFQIEI